MCGVTLSWSKRGHRLIWIGVLSFLLAPPAWLIWERTGSAYLAFLCLFPFAFLVAGLIRLRVEAYDQSKEDVEQEDAPNERPALPVERS